MAVGGRQFSPESINAAIKDAEAGAAPIQLRIAANGSDILDLHGGLSRRLSVSASGAQ